MHTTETTDVAKRNESLGDFPRSRQGKLFQNRETGYALSAGRREASCRIMKYCWNIRYGRLTKFDGARSRQISLGWDNSGGFF